MIFTFIFESRTLMLSKLSNYLSHADCKDYLVWTHHFCTNSFRKLCASIKFLKSPHNKLSRQQCLSYEKSITSFITKSIYNNSCKRNNEYRVVTQFFDAFISISVILYFLPFLENEMQHFFAQNSNVATHYVTIAATIKSISIIIDPPIEIFRKTN